MLEIRTHVYNLILHLKKNYKSSWPPAMEDVVEHLKWKK